jgi:hypothetical protein
MVHRFSRFIPIFVISVAVVVFGYIGGIPVHAEAGPSQAITLSPSSTDVAIDPGSALSKTVDVINGGSEPFNITLTTSPYYVLGENYDPQFTQLPGTVDASRWVHPSVAATTVPGNKTLTIPFTVTVPKDTAPGGYYAVLFVETSTNDVKTGVVSHNRVGDILYITVNGDIKSGGNITGISLPSLSFVGTIPIGAKISNTGGTHFVTKAVYIITDMGGHQVYNSTTERYVLPQTEREISVPWNPQSLFGIFTVHRSATIAGTVQSLPDEKIVIINPWLIVVIAFLVGILIGIPVTRARRRRRSQ